jgi:4-hydroxy-tetrahydrodipicolinate synthase
MSSWTDPIIHPITGARTPAYLNGVIVPMYTPATPEGSLDEQGIRNYTDWLIENGSISTLFPRSGLGQMYEFDLEKVRSVIDIVTDQAGGRIPVMPGCGGAYDGGRDPVDNPQRYYDESIELSNHAAERGCITVVLVMPYALHGRDMDRSQVEEVTFDYYRTVAQSISLPVLIYQPPVSRRRYRIGSNLVARLIDEVPQIVGMKYSTADLGRIMRVAQKIDGRDWVLISGNEAVFMQAFTAGACGIVGQGCTNNPEVLLAVYERLMSGDYAGALSAAMDVLRGIRATGRYSPAIGGLAYLTRKGVDVPTYSLKGGKDIPASDLDRIEVKLDEIRGKYLAEPWWETHS